MKDVILKKIDVLRDELKWWMNVVLVVISALVGGVFSLSQNKIDLNLILIGILFFLLIVLIYGTLKLKKLKTEININLKEIKKVKKW